MSVKKTDTVDRCGMTKRNYVLYLIKNICGTSLMKCHDVNYATVKNQSGLNNKRFSTILHDLSKLSYVERIDNGWKITKTGLDVIKSCPSNDYKFQPNVDELVRCLKNIVADLVAMKRMGTTPTKKWMSITSNDINSALNVDD